MDLRPRDDQRPRTATCSWTCSWVRAAALFVVCAAAFPAFADEAQPDAMDAPSVENAPSVGDAAATTDVTPSWDVAPADAASHSAWDVPPITGAGHSDWDVPAAPGAGDRAWDVDGPPHMPARGTAEAPAPTAPRAAVGVVEPTSRPGALPTVATDEGSASAADVPARNARYAGYMAASSAQFQDTHYRLRLTPFTGYREVVSVSFAWTKPEFFELELGVFLNPFGERTTVTLLPPVGDAPPEEQRSTERVLGVGTYVRASIVYPLFDKRGVMRSAWTGDLLIGLELRALNSRGDWALLSGIHAGAEFTRWIRSDRGVSVGALVGAPFWDLVSRQSLGFRPIVRVFVGLAF